MTVKKIIAHRGFHEISHENTVNAFLHAIDTGADMIEFDIRRTADNILVAFHDPSIIDNNREYQLKDLLFCDLQSIAENQNFDVPTVETIFQICAGQIDFDIELKEDNCEEEILSFIDMYECEEHCLITSFKETVLWRMQSLRSHIPCGLLIDNMSSINPSILSAVHMLCPSVEVFCANRSFFSSWKGNADTVAVWTVDDQTILEQMLSDPLVDAVITNKSELALRLRSKRKI